MPIHSEHRHVLYTVLVCLVASSPLRAQPLTRSEEHPSSNPYREMKHWGLTLHPAADIMLTYDSNAWLNEEGEEESDLFMDLVLGLSGRFTSGRNSLTLGGWYRMRRYDEISRLDSEDWTLTLAGVIGGEFFGLSDRWTVRPRAAYSKTMDYTHDADELLLHDEEDGMVPMGRPDRELQRRLMLGIDAHGTPTDKTHLDLGYGYRRIRFEREDLLDDVTHRVGGRISLNATERTRLLLAGNMAEMKNDGLDDAARKYALRLGGQHRRTVKLSLNAETGYYWFEADDSDVDREGISIQARAVWRMTEKTQLSLAGRNSMELAEDDPGNARQVWSATAALRHRITSRLWWDTAVGYRHEDYNRPSPPPDMDIDIRGRPRREVPLGERPFRDPEREFIDRTVKQYFGRLGAQYWVTTFASVRATGTYEITEDNVIGDYDQYRLTLAARVAF